MIECMDSIDQIDITMRDVFDELVRVMHEESPLCMPFFLIHLKTLP
jgi:hypothetical protein